MTGIHTYIDSCGAQVHARRGCIIRGESWLSTTMNVDVECRMNSLRAKACRRVPLLGHDRMQGTDFGQSRFGHPDLTNVGQSNFGQSNFGQSISGSGVCHGPQGGAPNGGAREWGPEGWRAAKFLVFFRLPPPVSHCFSLTVCLLVVFLVVFGSAGAVKCARLEVSGCCVKPRRPRARWSKLITTPPTRTTATNNKQKHSTNHNNKRQTTTRNNKHTAKHTPTPTTTQHNTTKNGLAKNGLAEIGLAEIGQTTDHQPLILAKNELAKVGWPNGLAKIGLAKVGHYRSHTVRTGQGGTTRGGKRK